MNLPVLYQPRVGSDVLNMMLLAFDISRTAKSGSGGKKLTLADMDEYWDFCRAAANIRVRSQSA
ncbi:MAG: hypothetical protein J0I98_00280 [Mesorhizobium sp.]|nr:hypothetical protein [Mesorhizobium sp.]MBN9241210.1 hypothetical protein [Mesorhizobium sp.]